MENKLQQLFNKIENCNKWIDIHKKNLFDSELREFCSKEIERLQQLKKEYQNQFNKLYNESN